MISTNFYQRLCYHLLFFLGATFFIATVNAASAYSEKSAQLAGKYDDDIAQLKRDSLEKEAFARKEEQRKERQKKRKIARQERLKALKAEHEAEEQLIASGQGQALAPLADDQTSASASDKQKNERVFEARTTEETLKLLEQQRLDAEKAEKQVMAEEEAKTAKVLQEIEQLQKQVKNVQSPVMLTQEQEPTEQKPTPEELKSQKAEEERQARELKRFEAKMHKFTEQERKRRERAETAQEQRTRKQKEAAAQRDEKKRKQEAAAEYKAKLIEAKKVKRQQEASPEVEQGGRAPSSSPMLPAASLGLLSVDERSTLKRQADAAVVVLVREEKKVEREQRNVAMQEERLVRLSQMYADHKFDYLYVVPSWPLQAQPFEKADLLQSRLTYKTANQAYSSHGKVKHLSNLIFGQESIAFTDACLVAKLVQQGNLTALAAGTLTDPLSSTNLGTVANNLLVFLAGESFGYKATTHEIRNELQFVRHLRGDDIAFGVNLPIVYKQHNLTFQNKYANSGTLGAIANSSDIQKLGGTFESVINTLLTSNGVNFNKQESRSGIGDVDVFATFQVCARQRERVSIGGKFTFPTAQNRDMTKLWGPELGNGGFPAASLYVSALVKIARFFNPNVFAQATFFVPTSLMRRVPKFMSGTGPGVGGVKGTSIDSSYPLSQYTTKAVQKSFTGIDSPIPLFATTTTKVKLQPFPEFTLQLGNSFEKFILRNGFLDLFYNLRIKAKDSLGGGLPENVWAPRYLLNGTSQVEQIVGMQLSYQFDEMIRIKFDGQYTFAGRNVPRTLMAGLSISADF